MLTIVYFYAIILLNTEKEEEIMRKFIKKQQMHIESCPCNVTWSFNDAYFLPTLNKFILKRDCF